MIIAARANLGVYDARYVEKDGRNWIEVATNNFLFAVQMINLKRCDGNLSGKINPLLMALARSKELLGHPWNQELPRCPRLQENLKILAASAPPHNNLEGLKDTKINIRVHIRQLYQALKLSFCSSVDGLSMVLTVKIGVRGY